MSKTLVVLTFTSILAQIIFSFYYSSNIVNQNNLLDVSKQKYQQLILELADTTKQMASLTSIQHFTQSTPSASLTPNFKSIKVSNF
jgi:hypothetical protein